MSKRQFLLLIGVWVMVFLFLGLPPLWHKILAALTGLAIILIVYTIKSTPKPETEDKGRQGIFVENNQDHIS